MKNYVITGSIGHISKPVIVGLVKAGKAVSVVTSSADKVKEIEALGAKAIVGSVFDAAFVNRAFQGADAVYTMIPPIWQTSNWRASQREVAVNYTAAIKSQGVKYVVDLSSVGAHLPEGVGPVGALHEFEQMLNGIAGLNVKHLRPSFFYYNFFAQIALVKQAGIMGANYGVEGQKVPLVHTDDIARVALEELLALSFTGNSVRYILSDLRTPQEITEVLGKAVGQKFHWVVFTDEQQKEGLLKAGLSETHSHGYTEMGSAIRSGKMQEEIIKHQPEKGSVKLEDFAKEFAAAFSA
jgi:uncharacterized protein YbjT (DUF2867 family)